MINTENKDTIFRTQLKEFYKLFKVYRGLCECTGFKAFYIITNIKFTCNE